MCRPCRQQPCLPRVITYPRSLVQIAFSNLQQEVLVYQFLGPTSRTNEEALSDQLPKTMSFDRCGHACHVLLMLLPT